MDEKRKSLMIGTPEADMMEKDKQSVGLTATTNAVLVVETSRYILLLLRTSGSNVGAWS